MFFVQTTVNTMDSNYLPLMNYLPPENNSINSIPVSSDIMVALFRREVAENKEEAESVIIFISTHGAGNGKFHAYEGEFTMNDIWKPFQIKDGYRGKPKIFIIDCCRGENIEEAAYTPKMFLSKEVENKMEIESPEGGKSLNEEVELSPKVLPQEMVTKIFRNEMNFNVQKSSDKSQYKRAQEEASQNKFNDESSLPMEEQLEEMSDDSDIVIGLATVNGNISIQNEKGSPYIQELCTQLIESKDECSLLDLMTSTNFQIATGVPIEGRSVNGHLMPTFTSSLRKDICL
ncbi:uncharacterized protein [Hetaerina americana]|uniref:uncharacterized protein n=1 Tax=Hetaerina americana TaxID=62018 RepID=UPI003A7F314A